MCIRDSTETVHLIAWDLDITLDSVIHPLVQVESDWGEIRDNCENFDIGIGFIEQRSAACDPLFAAWLEHSDRYQAVLDDLVNGAYSSEAVQERLTTWIDQIEEATAEAHETFGDDALSPQEWQDATDSLRDIIDETRTKVVDAAADLPS